MKLLRMIALVVILAVMVIGIGQKAGWAAPPKPIDVVGFEKTGANTYTLGNCISGSVKDLKPDYKLNVSVLETWNSYRTEGLPPMPIYYWILPGGTEDIFSCVAVVKVMEKDTLLPQFPLYKEDQYTKEYPFIKGSAEVCLETPDQKKQGYIYWYDEFRLFYNKDVHGEFYPNWIKVGGPFPGGTKACVPVTYSGIYAYYSPDPEKELGPDKVQEQTRYRKEGTVLVPYTVLELKMNGPFALGGCVTGNLENIFFEKGYEVKMEIKTSLKPEEELPKWIGEFYRCIVDVKFYKDGVQIEELPEADGYAKLCYAIPPYKDGTMYYFDAYYDEKPEWERVSDHYKTGIACSPIMRSGYYGMVDVQEPAITPTARKP